VELLSTNFKCRYTHRINPSNSQSFIPAFGSQPPGRGLPKNSCVQLNRLRTGVGRFAANMKTLDLCSSDCASAARYRLHTTSCRIASNLNLRATSVK